MSGPNGLPRPDADLRPLLAERPRTINAYAAGRIAESYSNVETVLAHCPGISLDSAYDVGSGAGHESFGLAAHFERVVACDTSRRAVWQARRAAKAAGLDRIEFQRADAERWRPDGRFSLVFSNVMSHNGSSRLQLLDELRAVMDDGGWLVYSEECEGYPPMEIHRAIEARDTAALRERLRQVLNGCLGRPGFRFFLAGSAGPELERLGFEIAERERKPWRGIDTLERLWARAARPAERAEREDPDYSSLDPGLRELRGWMGELVERARTGGLDAGARDEVERRVGESGNRLAPYLLYVLMAAEALPSFEASPSPVERARRRGPSWARPADPDWGRLEELDRAFLASTPGE